MKNKLCIYLDQFAVSEMVGLNPNIYWKEIKELLIEHKKREKLFCPLSFEHYIETSQKNIKNAKAHDDFLFSLSDEFSFKHELFITSQLISSKIRSNNITLKTFLHQNTKKVFEESTGYERIKDARNTQAQLLADATSDLNELRTYTHTQKIDVKTKKGFINALRHVQTESFIKRLEFLVKKERIFIRGDKIGNEEVPNWIDQIIYQLLKKHKLCKKEISKLITELKRNGFKNIPTLNIKTTLMALMSLYSKQEHPSDHIDLMRISTGLPMSDIFLIDKKRKHEIIEAEIDKKYNAKIFSGTKEDLIKLIEELKSI